MVDAGKHLEMHPMHSTSLKHSLKQIEALKRAFDKAHVCKNWHAAGKFVLHMCNNTS